MLILIGYKKLCIILAKEQREQAKLAKIANKLAEELVNREAKVWKGGGRYMVICKLGHEEKRFNEGIKSWFECEKCESLSCSECANLASASNTYLCPDFK